MRKRPLVIAPLGLVIAPLGIVIAWSLHHREDKAPLHRALAEALRPGGLFADRLRPAARGATRSSGSAG